MAKYSLYPNSVKKLFDTIAPYYDHLNHLLSLGIDIYWRRTAVKELKGVDGMILDIATGTGDVAIAILNQNKFKSKVIGLDFSPPMIMKAKKKISKMGISSRILFILGDALSLPFSDNVFDASIIAFGLRNIFDKQKALSEMIRVVKVGGKVIILEFTLPEKGLLSKIYPFYFRKILPWIGGMLSGNKEAYEYLPESVYQFKEIIHYETLMKGFGLKDISLHHLTSGIAFVATGIKSTS